MIYAFDCPDCEESYSLESRAFHPPEGKDRECPDCGRRMDRIYACRIDTSGCKDPDDVAPQHRVAVSQERNLSKAQTAGIEAAHSRKIQKTRRDIANGGNKGAQRMTHQIPAALHAAKIKETGDRTYWDDPKNRNRHTSCKVD